MARARVAPYPRMISHRSIIVALLVALLTPATVAHAEANPPLRPAGQPKAVPLPRSKPAPPADMAVMTPPLPQPKPKAARPKAATVTPAPVAPATPEVTAPADPAPPKEAAPPSPPAPPAAPPRVSSQAAMSGDGYSACVADLQAAGVVFTPLGDVTEEGCTLAGAVKVKAVATPLGAVALSGDPTMLCSFARQLTGWVREVGAPLAFAYTGRKLTLIETGPGLVCRTRYNQPGQKVSEHAKGNALDIAGFRFDDGSRMTVRPGPADAEPKPSLMRAWRASGCGYFTTVLGPGSNAAHEEHLHFDYAMRSNAWNYRICE
jgi:hypothetical protein